MKAQSQFAYDCSMPDNSRQQNKTMELAEHFFNPRVIESDDVFDGLLRGLATQTSQKMDINLISDVSNFTELLFLQFFFHVIDEEEEFVTIGIFYR